MYKSYESQIKKIVARRGYGPWYQRDAWLTVKGWQAHDLLELFVYLDTKYPKLVLDN